MIRNALLLFCLFLVQVQASAQLKRSYYGSYEGKIAAYEINTGMETIPVQETPVTILLSKEEIRLTIGAVESVGKYNVLLETETYYVLEATLENQPARERILVFKKGKKISREGIRPQPDAILKKSKKK